MVPVKLAGIEFRYDSWINTAILMIVFMVCGLYMIHRQNVNSEETHQILTLTNKLLADDLAARAKSDSLIDTRLFNIESQMADHVAKMAEQQVMLDEILARNHKTKSKAAP